MRHFGIILALLLNSPGICEAGSFTVFPGGAVPGLLNPGDIVTFQPGTHTVGLLRLSNGVTYRGATGNRADVVLKGGAGNCSGAQATLCAESVSGASIRDLTVDNDGVVGNGLVIGPGSSAITVSNVRVTDIGLSPIVVGGVACTGSVPCTDLSSAPSNITFTNVEADNGAKTGNGHGFFIRSCRMGVVLLNARAHHMGTSGDPDGVHATNCPGLHITGGEFFANSEEGIDFSRTASNGNGCNDYMSGVCEVSGGRCHSSGDCGGTACQPWIIQGVSSHGNGVGGAGAGSVKITSCAHHGLIQNNTFDRNLQLDACPHDITIVGNRMGGLSLFGNNYGVTVEGNVIQCNSSSSCVRTARGDSSGLHTSVVTANEWRNNVVGNAGPGAAFSTGFAGVTSTAEYPAASGPRCSFTTGASASRSYVTTQLAQFKTDAVFGPGTGDGDVWVTGPVPSTTSTSLSGSTSTSSSTTRSSTTSTTSTTDPWRDIGHGVFTRSHVAVPGGPCNQVYVSANASLAVGVCD